MSPRYKLGHYRLIRRIGVGGMAEVYQAEVGGTQGFGKKLALKVLLPHLQRDQEVVNSFIDEANIAASLSHPNIVPIYDFGQFDGTYFLVMEFQDGWDLREVLLRARQQGRSMPVPAVAYIGHELAMALDHIHHHDRQIVHRDVSPHNLFVDRSGHVKLGDFGVAKAAARLAQTEQGQIKGKLAYLSPEQVSGDPVTCRTDVYAAGLLLFEMLTGHRYNSAEREVELLAHAMNPSWRLPSSVRPDAAALDDAVGAALQKHPAMRTRDAALLAEQLNRCLERHQMAFDARALARFVDELDQACAAGDQGEVVPVGALGVGRRATQPPIDGQASGTVRIPGEGVVAEDDPAVEPLEAPRRHAGRLLGGIVLGLLLVAAGAAAVVGLRGRRPAGGPSIDATAAIAVDSGLAVARQAVDAVSTPAPEDASPVPADAVARPDAASTRRLKPRRVRVPRAIRRPRARPDAAPALAVKLPRVEAPAAVEPANRRSWGHRLDRLESAARQRGLHPGDSAAYDRLRTAARRSIQGDGKGADAAFSRLTAFTGAFRVDQRFITRKLARLERAIARAPAGDRQRLQVASQRILRLMLGDRLVAASNQISRLLARLRR